MRGLNYLAVTIKDIARLAGVSANTVSRALNDKGEISPKTKQRVLRIAREQGYSKNSLAASLATSRTSTVGLITPDICDPFYAEQARGVEEAAKAKGYTMILIDFDEDPEAELSAVNTCRSKRVDGIILTSVFARVDHIEGLEKQGVPLVLLNRWLPSMETDFVINDNFNGAYRATRHLIDLGHKHIAHITGPLTITSVRERYLGYCKALEEAGLSVHPSLVSQGESLKPEAGEEAARQVLAGKPRPTAVFAYCDTLAIGVMSMARKMGLMIPEEMAVVGYDDIPLAAYLGVPLTTIAQPARDMGKLACQILIEKIEREGDEQGRPWPRRQVKTLASLVVRSSCGAPGPIAGSQPQNSAVLRGV
mgnify:CR=1 FL=1